jgi:hypothetical protein
MWWQNMKVRPVCAIVDRVLTLLVILLVDAHCRTRHHRATHYHHSTHCELSGAQKELGAGTTMATVSPSKVLSFLLPGFTLYAPFNRLSMPYFLVKLTGSVAIAPTYYQNTMYGLFFFLFQLCLFLNHASFSSK